MIPVLGVSTRSSVRLGWGSVFFAFVALFAVGSFSNATVLISFKSIENKNNSFYITFMVSAAVK